ncbi:Hypothetical protein A7982_04099 [Minicystis rosea]|nr:Hypothetical protein A7982_04099 [Minicystis rosea]
MTIGDCTCAAAFVLGGADAGACGKCGYDVATAGGTCAALQTTCSGDQGCQDAVTVCIQGCSTSANIGNCIAACIQGSTVYGDLVACQCAACQAECQGQPALSCDTGTGGGGTGGSFPMTGPVDAGGD